MSLVVFRLPFSSKFAHWALAKSWGSSKKCASVLYIHDHFTKPVDPFALCQAWPRLLHTASNSPKRYNGLLIENGTGVIRRYGHDKPHG